MQQQGGFTSPLTAAVMWGKHDNARVLLGAKASTAPVVGYPAPLWYAASGGDAEMVCLLLAAGADPHVESGSAGQLKSACRGMMTPLGVAAAKGHTAALEALLSSGALRTNSWLTTARPALPYMMKCALFAAIEGRHLGTVKVLLRSDHVSRSLCDALEDLSRSVLYLPRPLYDMSALLMLHVHTRSAADAFLTHPALVRVVDRGALSLALLRGWWADTAEVDAGHQAAAAIETVAAPAKADVRELLVQVGVGRKVVGGC